MDKEYSRSESATQYYNHFENMVFTVQQMAIVLPSPIEAVDYSKKWIKWGADNLFPLYLLDLYNRSSQHAAIINQKAMLIGGQGWDKSALSDDALLFLTNNGNEDDLDEILMKISFDFEIFNSFCLGIVWNREGTKIQEIKHISPKNVRIAARAKDYDLEDKYWVCDDWAQYSRCTPILYDGFSTINKQNRHQIYYYQGYRSGNEWYGIPGYISGIRWIEMEYEISNFHLNNIQRGFYPQMQINIPYGMNMPEDKKKVVVDKLKRQYAGSEKAGSQVFTFSDANKDAAITFTPIGNNASDQLFLMLHEQGVKSILKAHQINDGELFGESSNAVFNSKNMTMESLELFTTFYCEPRQKQIEKVFNRLKRVNDIKDRLTINNYEPKFSKVNTNLSDVLSILSSSITDRQKYFILLKNDYDAKSASELTGYVEGQEQNNNIQ